jgi:superfamily I DNA/RNA helicase
MKKQIILSNEQRYSVERQENKPLLIKGCAGSGKSLVAIYRAKSILSKNELLGQNNVIIFTYNKTLIAYLKNLSNELIGTNNNDTGRLIITNFHKWAWGFIRTYLGIQPEIIQKKGQSVLIQNLINISKVSNRIKILQPDFFISEFEYIKNNQISKLNYINESRKGRGSDVKLTSENKSQVWNLFEEYQNKLNETGMYDFSDLAIMALEYLESGKEYNKPFNNVIIDEAQDMSKIQLKVLSLVADNRLTILADGAQRIYQSGFSWKQVGIQIQGRTVELHTNYRNNEYIAKTAKSLIDSDSENSEYTVYDTANLKGNKPIIVYAKDLESQYEFILKQVKQLDLNTKSVVILHRISNQFDNIIKYFKVNGNIAVTKIHRDSDPEILNSPNVKLSTIHSIKGLEFDYVFIVEATDRMLPYYQGFNSDIDTEEHISQERRLLYTAMTRAKEYLYILNHSKQSRFIDEIDQNLIEKIDLVNPMMKIYEKEETSTKYYEKGNFNKVFSNIINAVNF